jgi:hypothetical protein
MAARIRRGRLDPPRNPFFVGRDKGLISMKGLLVTVPDPARLAVVPDARRSDDRSVNESASSHDDAMLIELPDDLHGESLNALHSKRTSQQYRRELSAHRSHCVHRLIV